MTLRQLWDSDRPTIGGWCRVPSAFSAELIGRAGFDWVCVDTQHGLAGHDTMVTMLQALDACAVPSLVRVAWNQPDLIMRALDAGAHGIVVPMVNTAEDARRAVGACHYAPHGFRSWGPTRASLGRPDYSVATANSQVVCMVMIETKEAVEDIDAILSVPGVDGAYVGPSDLAVSCGMPPGQDATRGALAALVIRVLNSCQRHNLVAGIHCPNADTACSWRDRGFRMLAVANDATFIVTCAAKVVDTFKAGDSSRQGMTGEELRSQ